MAQGGLIHILFELISAIIGIVEVILLIYVVISWLYAFDVVGRRNQFIGSIWEFTRRLSDPLLRPLRRLIPPISGVDLSVMLLLFILFFLQRYILPWLEGVLTGQGPVL